MMHLVMILIKNKFILTWSFGSDWPKGSGICSLLARLPYNPELSICKSHVGKTKVCCKL